MSERQALPHAATSGLTMCITALITAFLALILSACGGEGDPSTHLLLEADLSGATSEADRDAAMTSLVENLERRTIVFGAMDVDIQREDASRISITLRGVISEDEVRQLLEEEALVDLRQPVLDEEGLVLCQTLEGIQFAVSAEEITYSPEHASRRVTPRCQGSEGQSGDIIWEPVDPTAGQDPTQDETTAKIQPIGATVDRAGAPVVVVLFTPSAAELLEEITSRLIGLPLGIFVDDELLAGPTVQQALTTGNLVIAGLTLSDANILAAQLTAGPLPVPVEDVSEERISR